MQKDNKKEPDYVLPEGTSINTNNLNHWNEFTTIQFNSLDGKNKQKLTLGQYKKEYHHLVVYPGLNIRGTCETKTCQGYLKDVWVKREYGQMNLGQIRTKNNCPCCGKVMVAASFKTLGYTRAKVTFQGSKVVDGKDVDFIFQDEEKQGKFITFKAADQNTVQWNYLNINVMKN